MELPKDIPQICPKCNSILKHTNAIDYDGTYIVFCSNSRCRWIQEYEVKFKPVYVKGE